MIYNMTKSKELPKTYEPQKHEDKIYKKWEDSGFFNPDKLNLSETAKTYTIILPPPNITDKLHLGHASMLAIEDLMIRFKRMQGYRTLWLPGTDHAAIATQNVVEKKLFKEEGKTRHDLGREKFLERVWDFLRVTQSTILNQTRKMGASLDWSRTAFTLDGPREKAVKKMFVDMYNEGVIARGKRIVNWCPRCHSTLADDEVEYKESKTRLYWIKYGPFVLATTRPETKLGDTAVAVHPSDKRYKDMIGKKYMIPGVLGDFEITVIADRHVDMEFGSGAIKVTPAHSFADNEMAQKNDIPMKQIINEDGCMMDNCGKYAGMTTKEARKKIVADMEKMGLIDHIDENYENKLSVCYRCDTPIEPLPSKQWFVLVDKKIKRLGNKSLKEAAIEAAQKHDINFIPERFEKRYLHWMENLHDWCISRQIWFGHRIPVWYQTKSKVKSQKSKVDIYVGEKAPEGAGWVQDEDSLDTWFSSGMWTFSTLGWPENFLDGKKNGDLKKFHPTQVLETGYEILTLWVSRMIMMSFFALGEIPFENVYLHGMVLDAHGKKMSKSKGNGIDPLDMIKKYGTDAVRLSLLIGSTPGNDVRVSEEKIAGYRNFINKLWNISRFIISNFESRKLNTECQMSGLDCRDKLTLADVWILQKNSDLIKNITSDIEEYKFSQAGERLREFTWEYLADWYLEVSKFEKNDIKNDILLKILNDILKMLHPFTPFITEKIWSEMKKGKSMLMAAKWPNAEDYSEIINLSNGHEINFDLIMDIIKSIRNARSENRVEPNKRIKAYIYAGTKKELITSQTELIKGLRTGIEELIILDHKEKYANEIHVTVGDIEIYLIGAIDMEKEKERIKKEKENLTKLIANTEKKLSNKAFTDNAPEEIINQQKENLAKWRQELENLQ